MNKIKKILPLLLLMLVVAPSSCLASINGLKTNNVTVKLYFKRSPEWKDYVKVAIKDTDFNGVLEAKNVLEGWYKPVIIDKDTENGQKLAVRLRMLNEEGQRIKNAQVKMYIKSLSGVKTYIKTVDTDENGWVESEGLVSGREYYLEVVADKDEISNFSKKANQPRIKVKAKKIGKNKEGENWIQGFYSRVNEQQILEVGKIREGYYKFSLKKGDVLPQGFFHVKAELRDSDGKRIKKPTLLKLYAFPQDKKTYMGQLKTSEHGEVIMPKLVPNMKFQVVVVD